MSTISMNKITYGITVAACAVTLLGVPAHAGNSGVVRVCNRGDVPLVYGNLFQVRGSIYRLHWGRELEASDCATVSSHYGAVFFAIENSQTGEVYNPVYSEGRDIPKSDLHIKHVCVPKILDRFDKDISEKVVEKFQGNCPKNWAKLRTSFTIVTAGDQRTIINITPEADDDLFPAW